MKVFTVILKIVAALAAIAGIVYVFATYGDKIAAWAKNLINTYFPCCKDELAEEEILTEDEEPAEVTEEFAVEETDVQANPADFEA